MNLPNNLTGTFKEFVAQQYGAAWEKSQYNGETERTLVDGKLLIIRDHFPRRSEDAVEVFCSDKSFMKEVEGDFLALIASQEEKK